MEYYAAMKKNKALWTEQVVMLFTEINKLQNVIYSMSPLVLHKVSHIGI